MEDTFEIPVHYKNKNLAFKSKLLVFGYTHKFELEVDNEKILFEPDEEGDYRATIDPSRLRELKSLDKDLLHHISNAIKNILKK